MRVWEHCQIFCGSETQHHVDATSTRGLVSQHVVSVSVVATSHVRRWQTLKDKVLSMFPLQASKPRRTSLRATQAILSQVCVCMRSARRAFLGDSSDHHCDKPHCNYRLFANVLQLVTLHVSKTRSCFAYFCLLKKEHGGEMGCRLIGHLFLCCLCRSCVRWVSFPNERVFPKPASEFWVLSRSCRRVGAFVYC